MKLCALVLDLEQSKNLREKNLKKNVHLCSEHTKMSKYIKNQKSKIHAIPILSS